MHAGVAAENSSDQRYSVSQRLSSYIPILSAVLALGMVVVALLQVKIFKMTIAGKKVL